MCDKKDESVSSRAQRFEKYEVLRKKAEQNRFMPEKVNSSKDQQPPKLLQTISHKKCSLDKSASDVESQEPMCASTEELSSKKRDENAPDNHSSSKEKWPEELSSKKSNESALDNHSASNENLQETILSLDQPPKEHHATEMVRSVSDDETIGSSPVTPCIVLPPDATQRTLELSQNDFIDPNVIHLDDQTTTEKRQLVQSVECFYFNANGAFEGSEDHSFVKVSELLSDGKLGRYIQKFIGKVFFNISLFVLPLRTSMRASTRTLTRS